MSIAGRVGMVIGNVLLLLPMYMALLFSAILTAKASKNLDKLSVNSTVKKLVKDSAFGLWAFFIGALVFSFTLGLFVLPWLTRVPYFWGTILILLALVNWGFAAILFYAMMAVRKSPQYTDPSNTGHHAAKEAYKDLFICASLMTFGGVYMIGYSVFTMVRYHRSGGSRLVRSLGSERPSSGPLDGLGTRMGD